MASSTKIEYKGLDQYDSSFWYSIVQRHRASKKISIEYQKRDCTNPNYFRNEDNDILFFQHPANLLDPLTFTRIFANGFRTLKPGGIVIASFHDEQERSAFIKSIEPYPNIEILANEAAPKEIYSRLPRDVFTLFSQIVILKKNNGDQVSTIPDLY
ncbi:MAG: hypothetical protein O2962_02315 [Cyanobacteria bacterium]|nr:hypothetical protein [Cyanobacteriota bacterium]